MLLHFFLCVMASVWSEKTVSTVGSQFCLSRLNHNAEQRTMCCHICSLFSAAATLLLQTTINHILMQKLVLLRKQNRITICNPFINTNGMLLIQKFKHCVNFNIYQGFYFDIIVQKSIDQNVLNIKISIFLLYFRNSTKNLFTF